MSYQMFGNNGLAQVLMVPKAQALIRPGPPLLKNPGR